MPLLYGSQRFGEETINLPFTVQESGGQMFWLAFALAYVALINIVVHSPRPV